MAVTVPDALHTTVVVPAASTTTSGRLTGASRASVTTGPHRSAGPVGAVAPAGAVVSSMAAAASVAAVLLLAMAPLSARQHRRDRRAGAEAKGPAGEPHRAGCEAGGRSAG